MHRGNRVLAFPRSFRRVNAIICGNGRISRERKCEVGYTRNPSPPVCLQ